MIEVDQRTNLNQRISLAFNVAWYNQLKIDDYDLPFKF